MNDTSRLCRNAPTQTDWLSVDTTGATAIELGKIFRFHYDIAPVLRVIDYHEVRILSNWI